MTALSVTPYDQQFAAAGVANNVDPNLGAAVAAVESGYNPAAVSPAQATGLMQLEPATAQGLGVTNPADPAQNINGGMKYLGQMLSQFGNVPDALMHYNAGPNGNVNNPETQAYVGKVQAAYQDIMGAGGIQYAQADTGNATDAGPAPVPGRPSDAAMMQMMTVGGASSTGSAPSSETTGTASPGSVQPIAGRPSDAAMMQALTAGASSSSAASDAGAPPASTPSAPGFWSNVGAGLEHSIAPSGPLFGALNNMTAWGDKNIPGAQALDNIVGGPSAAQNAMISANVAAGQKQFQQGAGQTLGGQLGDAAGSIALTGPLAEAGAGVVGGTLGAAADALPAASLGNRLFNAGQTLATGSGAGGFGGKLIAASSSGALKGAIGNTAAGGTPGQGVVYGAALGPVGMAAVPLARGALLLGGRAASGLLDSLAPGAASDAGDVAGAVPGAAPGGAQAAPQAIPTSLPKTGLNITQKGADATADRIIAHFAQGGPTDINDNALLTASDGSATKPSLAQVTGNAGIATLERAVQAEKPQAFAQQWAGNDDVRNQVLSSLTGTPGDIDSAIAYRDATTSQARTAAFADAKPVDAQPVVDQVNQLIAQNAGRPTVQGPLQQVLNQLEVKVPDPTVDPATGLPTPGATIEQAVSDPATLYNVRKYIGDIISPKAAGTAQDGRAAAAQLMTLKPVLDDTIESGAPGYKDYIAQYDALSQPIDGMQALQKLNLYDASGNVTLPKIDNAIKSLTAQQNAPGYKLADSITPEQMGQLVALRDNMRQAGQSNLGRSLGSNTFQNFATNSLINAAGSHAGHAVGAVLSAAGADAAVGPLGMVAAPLGYAASHIIGNIGAKSRGMVMESLTNKLLNPQAASNALMMATKAGAQKASR